MAFQNKMSSKISENPHGNNRT